MKRKLFTKDIEEDEEIDFDGQNITMGNDVELNEQMIRNLDSHDEKMRELSCISIANLSSSMEPEFYSKFLSPEIIRKLADRITDPYSQISLNSLSALQRLASLSKVHNRSAELEASLKSSMLISTLKAQGDSACTNIKTSLQQMIENKVEKICFDHVASGKLTFCIKVLQLIDTFLEHFRAEFFLSEAMVGLFKVLVELFLLFADLYILLPTPDALEGTIVDYLEQFPSMLSTMLEDTQFAGQIMANNELTTKLNELSAKDNSLVSSSSTSVKLVLIEYLRDSGSNAASKDQLKAGLTEIGQYLQRNLLEVDKSSINFQTLTSHVSESKMQVDKSIGHHQGSGNDYPTDCHIKSLRLLRSHTILFAKYFEFEESRKPDELDLVKLQVVDSSKVEELLKFLLIDLPRFSLHTSVSKKLLREAENLIYCDLSAILNYFLFATEVSKKKLTVNLQYYSFVEEAFRAMVVGAVGEDGQSAKSELDLRFLEPVMVNLLKLLNFLIELVDSKCVKSVTKLQTSVLLQFMLACHNLIGSQELDKLLLKFSAHLHSNVNIRSAEDLEMVTGAYLQVVDASKDLATVCTAVDAIIETHSEDDHKAVFAKCGVLEVLGKIKGSLLGMIKQKIKEGEDSADLDVLQDVSDNLEGFLDYKRKTLK